MRKSYVQRTIEEKASLINQVETLRAQGLSQARAVKQLGLNLSSIWKWQAEVKRAGLTVAAATTQATKSATRIVPEMATAPWTEIETLKWENQVLRTKLSSFLIERELKQV